MSATARSWVLLLIVVAGWALGDAVGAELGFGGNRILVAAFGALAAYLASQPLLAFLERGRRRRGRGQIKYWRGQRFEDDEGDER